MSFEFPIEKSFGNRKFRIAIAENVEQIDEVFRLRYRVFNEELHEGLASSVATGRDQDRFDQFCDQLIIVDMDLEKIVGTYRLHRFDRAISGLGFYSASEFDLTTLIENNYRLLEIGRACIDPDFRDGSVMSMLWYGLARYMQKYDLHYLVGCASLEKGASIEQASLIYAYAKAINKLAAKEFQVSPNEKIASFNANVEIEDTIKIKRSLPALLRGYFTIGCKIAGEPAYDPEFDVIDFFVIFDFLEITNGPARRFMS